MVTIYIITNILNGKQYIGQTIRSFDVRLSEHIKGKYSSAIHNAIKKYGINNFHIECLEISDELANLWETHLIKRWKTKGKNNGYNLADGGAGVVGPTDETKKKISNTLIGNIPWNKGKKTGHIPKSVFKKGCNAWNKRSGKRIILTHPDGTEELFDNCMWAARKYCINNSGLYGILNGKGKTYKGFRVRYAE